MYCINFHCYRTFMRLHHQSIIRIISAFIFTFVMLLIMSVLKENTEENDENVLEFSPNQSIKFDTVRYSSSVCVLPFVILRRKRFSTKRVSLLLHASAAQLFEDDQLLQSVSNWDGPVDVALLVNSPQDSRLKSIINVFTEISHLIACTKILKERLNVHIVFSYSNAEECPSIFLEKPGHCKPNRMKRHIDRDVFTLMNATYPINLLRNVAKRFSQTEYGMIADLEEIFSGGSEARLHALAEELRLDRDKAVLVVRRFEHHSSIRTPRTISELREHYGRNVFEFHEKFHPLGHKIPHLREWMSAGDDSYSYSELRYREQHWEPRFLAYKGTPEYDEKIYFGDRDQVTMCWRLCASGYRFLIVDGVFSVHRGVRDEEYLLRRNKKVWPRGARDAAISGVTTFAKKLFRRYPRTAPRCLNVTSFNRYEDL